MSYGYKKKTKPALWRDAFPEQMQTREEEKTSEQYAVAAKTFIRIARTKNPLCEVGMQIFGKAIKVSQVHHIRGRIGGLLFDQAFWLPARSRGWLAKKGDWNREP